MAGFLGSNAGWLCRFGGWSFDDLADVVKVLCPAVWIADVFVLVGGLLLQFLSHGLAPWAGFEVLEEKGLQKTALMLRCVNFTTSVASEPQKWFQMKNWQRLKAVLAATKTEHS